MTKQEIPQLLEKLQSYIDKSAQEASTVLMKNKMYLEIAEGVRLDLTPDVCTMVYKDLIIQLLTEQRAIQIKYAMFAMMVPMSRQIDGTLVMSIRLGVLFPDL